ncbi:MAG: hypothetical protein JXB25_06635 [Deltaproteobacteria bacterium]|nr:hypothetical protein [Deltaproteobacteria bacterium]
MITILEKIKSLGTDQVLTLASGATLIFWGLAMILAKRFVRKRTSEMKQVALQLAFSFREAGDGSILHEFSTLPLFSGSQRGFEENLLTRGMDQAFIAVFDYTTKKTKDLSLNWEEEETNPFRVQTMACFKTNNLFLPPFSLRPETSLDATYVEKLENKFGYQPIECRSFPQFAANYRLFGKKADEEKIRGIFLNSGIIILCEKEGDLCMEAKGESLIVYRHLKRIPPQEMEQFLETAIQVHDILDHSAIYYQNH